MAFDAQTLAMTSALNVTPNGSEGAIWQSGGGLAADPGGNIYALVGNGTLDTTLDSNGFPSQGDFGNSFLKLSTSGSLAVTDYFAPYNTGQEDSIDADLGAGGPMLLPDLTDGSGDVWHLAVGAGKDWNIYVVNRDSMGKFDSNANNIYQEIPSAFQAFSPGGIFSTPAYYNNTLYYGANGNPILAFGIMNAMLTTLPTSQTADTFGYPGSTPGISANGTSGAILWALEKNSSGAVLHAYDATNLSIELYNSNQAPAGRDEFGAAVKFVTPTIANGRVYVSVTNGVAVFGLLPVRLLTGQGTARLDIDLLETRAIAT